MAKQESNLAWSNSQTDHAQPATSSAKNVIVVGGGLAGMAAATALGQAGFKVRLLESKRRLGGRAGSFTDPATGWTVDYCQHVGMGCCTNLADLMRRWGTSDQWHREKHLHFIGPDGSYLRLGASFGMPAPLHLHGLLSKWPGLHLKQRLEIARGLWQLLRLPSRDDLDYQSAIKFLRNAGQSEESIENFWSTIIVSALGEQLERVALGPVRKVILDGFAANRNAYHLLVPQRPLSELINEGGRKALESCGVQVDLQKQVVDLTWDSNDRCTGVCTRQGETIEADAIILAIPWFAWPAIADRFPTCVRSKVRDTKSLGESPITGVHTWWDKPWLPYPHAAIVGRLCQWVFRNRWEETRPDNFYGHYYQIVVSASRSLKAYNSEQALQVIVDDIQQIFPAARSARLLHGRIITDPQSVFSLTPEASSVRPAHDALWEHRILLAGDWTRTGWPATMEGAIRSGYQAAQTATGRTFLQSDLPKGLLSRWLIAG